MRSAAEWSCRNAVENDKRKKYRANVGWGSRRRKRKLVPCPDRARWRDNLICARRLPAGQRQREGGRREREKERRKRETKSEGGHSERGKKSTQKDRPSKVCACVRAFARAWEKDRDESGDQCDGTGPTVQSRKQGTALTWLQPPRVTGVSSPLHSRSPALFRVAPLTVACSSHPLRFLALTRSRELLRRFSRNDCRHPFYRRTKSDLYLYHLRLNQFRSLMWSWDALLVRFELRRLSWGIGRCIPARKTILQRCAGPCFCVEARSLFVIRRFPVLLLYEDYARARNTGGFLITSPRNDASPIALESTTRNTSSILARRESQLAGMRWSLCFLPLPS